MGRLVTKPFHSDDVTKMTNRPIRAALEKSHVGLVTWLGHARGCHARGCHAVTQGLEIVGNRPHHFFQTTTWFIPNFLKKGLQAGTCANEKEKKGRRPFFMNR